MGRKMKTRNAWWLRELTLENSEAYQDDPKGASALWENGFRPIRARELKPNMEIMYRETMFEFPTSKHGVTLIGDVLYDEPLGTVTVSTWDRGNIQTDELAEVWARKEIQ